MVNKEDTKDIGGVVAYLMVSPTRVLNLNIFKFLEGIFMLLGAFKLLVSLQYIVESSHLSKSLKMNLHKAFSLPINL